MTLEVLIQTAQLDPEGWIEFPEYGFRQYFLWKNPANGASIALLEYERGGRIPVKHSHASNQFMYCLEGDYEYTDSGLRLKPGHFYMNPKDHPHGPTLAHERSVLIEIYDGPHYYEKPIFHTDETIGDFLSDETSPT
ncbi:MULTISPECIES: cupin domain-containing protein [unclassified Pseudomonas]|uniref:cupin domain-containing protein n=1 Tax=Pseudomonas TaxID=286 RepID=UPI000871823D|nr:MULTISPECIES: cupin domain-containing protein [unclassified Pseudomonas]SCW35946.1 Cupin domain-containing protein [Pseudomonas sp. NFACC56-3]SFK16587.1 Cupin domain-containing protein [Pseudomonas sp. NFACC52]